MKTVLVVCLFLSIAFCPDAFASDSSSQNPGEIVNFEEFAESQEWQNFHKYNNKTGELHFGANGDPQLWFFREGNKRKVKKLELPAKYFDVPYGVNKFKEALEGRKVTINFYLFFCPEFNGSTTPLPRYKMTSPDLITNVLLNTDPRDAWE